MDMKKGGYMTAFFRPRIEKREFFKIYMTPSKTDGRF